MLVDTNKKTKHWDNFAAEYENQVYSLTSFPEKIVRILDKIREIQRDRLKILIVGCGSATHLQKAILNDFPEAEITACDFSDEMLQQSQKKFFHPSLNHQFGDTTNLGFKREFDIAISTNSIIPPTREMVKEMYASINLALKAGGRFIAYLPSFEAASNFGEVNPAIRLDEEGKRMWDTNDWQCFHTKELIDRELRNANFSKIETQIIAAESRKEIEELWRLYGKDADKHFHLHFTTAEKKPSLITPRSKENLDNSQIRNLTSPEITQNEIELVARLYKTIFDNAGHYLINPRSGEFFSPADIFGENREFSFEELMNPPHKIDKKTGEELDFFHHYETTERNIGKKLKDNAFLSLLGEVGFTFANLTTPRKAFSKEGWEDSLSYSKAKSSKKRSWKDFLTKINAAIKTNHQSLNVSSDFQLQEDSKIITINAIGILSQARGKEDGIHLAKKLLEIIPPSLKKTCLDLAEATPGCVAASKNKHGVIFIPEFNIGENILTLGRIANY
jgi:SAM-dependent methyltransferase